MKQFMKIGGLSARGRSAFAGCEWRLDYDYADLATLTVPELEWLAMFSDQYYRNYVNKTHTRQLFTPEFRRVLNVATKAAARDISNFYIAPDVHVVNKCFNHEYYLPHYYSQKQYAADALTLLLQKEEDDFYFNKLSNTSAAEFKALKKQLKNKERKTNDKN